MADADIIPQPSKSLADALDAKIPDSKIADVLELAMTANQVERDGTVRLDHKIRLAAAQVALAYRHGRPIERQQILTANVGPTDSDLIERLAHSPALRAAIRDAVEAAEGKVS